MKRKIFGRMVDSKKQATCDVCGCAVGFGSYIYLCIDCYKRLPKYAKQNHNWLIPWKKPRKEYLTKAIEKYEKEKYLKKRNKKNRNVIRGT